MKSTRRKFLGAALAAPVVVSSARVILSLAGGAIGAAPVMVSVASAASEVEPPSPSPAAREFALTMRSFDETLDDKQIHDIAKGIDDGWKSGRKLHKGLSNGDPPSPAFEIGE